MWNLRSASAAPVLLQSGSPQRGTSPSAPLRPPPDPDVARALSARGAGRSGRSMQRYSPDGSQLAVGGFEIDAVRVLDPLNRNGRPLSVRKSPGGTYVTYSTDGSRLAAVNALEVRIWDVRNPDSSPVVIPQPPDTRDRPMSMAFSIDNGRLAVGMEDVRVYDLRQPGAAPLVLRGVPSVASGFTALAFSPDGYLVAAGNTNGTTRLWDLRSPTAPPLYLPSPPAVAAILFSPDGQYLAASGVDTSVRLWRLGSAGADYLCTRVWRNLTMDEWRLYVGETIPYERTCPGLPDPPKLSP
jgi:hypothetical protein